MKLSLIPYQLRFKYPFRIAHGIRETTDVVYVKLEHEQCVGWGEATLPPYLPETQQSVIDFLSGLDLSFIKFPFNPFDIAAAINQQSTGNLSARAALDMALWNLKSQMEGIPIGELLGIPARNFPLCTYTIGVCTFDEMKVKVEDALSVGFQMFKLKLNGEQDEEMVRNYRELCKLPFAVDVNQGWKDEVKAIDTIKWLAKEGCVLVEQPLHKDALREMEFLKPRSVLPLYADESCQRLSDIDRLKNGFHGINIKLMKCGGISEAWQMLDKAKELGMKILVGCMSESSVGCTSAAHLTPLAHYADLDGPYLIANDEFRGIRVEQGKIAIHPLQAVNTLGA